MLTACGWIKGKQGIPRLLYCIITTTKKWSVPEKKNLRNAVKWYTGGFWGWKYRLSTPCSSCENYCFYDEDHLLEISLCRRIILHSVKPPRVLTVFFSQELPQHPEPSSASSIPVVQTSENTTTCFYVGFKNQRGWVCPMRGFCDSAGRCVNEASLPRGRSGTTREKPCDSAHPWMEQVYK